MRGHGLSCATAMLCVPGPEGPVRSLIDLSSVFAKYRCLKHTARDRRPPRLNLRMVLTLYMACKEIKGRRPWHLGMGGGTPGGQKLPALLAAPAPQPAQPGEDRRTSTWPNGHRGRTCRVDGRGRSSGSRRGLFLCALLDSLPLSSRRPVNPLHTRTPSRLRRRAQRHEDAQHAPRTRVAGRSQVGQTRDADYSTF